MFSRLKWIWIYKNLYIYFFQLWYIKRTKRYIYLSVVGSNCWGEEVFLFYWLSEYEVFQFCQHQTLLQYWSHNNMSIYGNELCFFGLLFCIISCCNKLFTDTWLVTWVPKAFFWFLYKLRITKIKTFISLILRIRFINIDLMTFSIFIYKVLNCTYTCIAIY